ncbi:MAG: flippase-like domain-containing protein [bacterium]|nr:flippase-like domain-containing protein [bacterium]
MNRIKWLQERLWLFSIPLAIGLVVLVINEIGWNGLVKAIRNFSFSTWFMITLFMCGSLSSQVFRSWILLRTNSTNLRLIDVVKAALGAFTAGSLTPGRLGDAALVLLMPGTTGKALGISLIDRLMYWPPMHLFGILSLGILFSKAFGWISVVLSLVICLGYFLTYEWIFHKTRNKKIGIKENSFIHQLYEGFTLIPHNILRIGVLLGFVQYGFVACQFVFSLQSIGWNGGFITGLFVFGALQLIRSFIAITPGNLGTSELVGMVLGNLLFQSKDLLPQVTISLFLINSVFPAILGLPFWISLSKKLKNK